MTKLQSLLGTVWGTVHKSTDGETWNLIRTEGEQGSDTFNYCYALSVITGNLNATKIVTI